MQICKLMTIAIKIFFLTLFLGACAKIPLPKNQEAVTSQINLDDPKFSNKALVSGLVNIVGTGIFKNTSIECAQAYIQFTEETTKEKNILVYSSDPLTGQGVDSNAFISINPGTHYVTHVECFGPGSYIEFSLEKEFQDLSTRNYVPQVTLAEGEVVFVGTFELKRTKQIVNQTQDEVERHQATLHVKPVEGIRKDIARKNTVLADKLTIRLATHTPVEGVLSEKHGSSLITVY
ncbi:hypothetical protein [Kiloniella majae]|uniref:hypothetical protein n=1 Tax=Kiloniella majae TaxID=1938558 RepID=UPI000A277852|nr:hypothetical protein [Kiloniella majae]